MLYDDEFPVPFSPMMQLAMDTSVVRDFTQTPSLRLPQITSPTWRFRNDQWCSMPCWLSHIKFCTVRLSCAQMSRQIAEAPFPKNRLRRITLPEEPPLSGFST